MKPLDFQDLVIKRLNKLEAALLAVLEPFPGDDAGTEDPDDVVQ